MKSVLADRLFHLKENGTTVRRECFAGLTTFVTMAYILAVNPAILGAAGMDRGAVFTASALAACAATLLMALLSNYPFALAPGMGLNAYFAYTVVIKQGYSWQMALAAVFLEGLLFIVLSVTSVREAIFNSIPRPLKLGVTWGIGLFILFIGLQNSKLIVADPSTMLSVYPFREAIASGEIRSVGLGAVLAFAGILLTAILTIRRVKGALLLGILAACAEPQPASAVNARVDELQENNFSVYSAANLCSLLEKAGAIERVTAEGEPAEDIEIEPQTVVVDGVEYLEAREPVEIYWHITEPGRAALEADKPLERLRALLDEDAAYAPIYQRILRLCTADGGATTPAINNAVDHNPLVQKPRFYAPHFVDRLEKCDALAWKKAWCITDIGRAGLDMLADVVDENAPATQPETPATPDPAASKED